MKITIVSITVSFLLGLWVIKIIRSRDVFEEEPILKMLLSMVVGGFIAVGVSLILYFVAHHFNSSKHINLFVKTFFLIGPVEEFSKYLGFMLLLKWLQKELNEPVDYLVYFACVALGFSIIENYMYANSIKGHQGLLIIRLFICTPMHIAYTTVIGMAVYLIDKKGHDFSTFAKAFIFASFLHGLLDFLVMNKSTAAFLFLFLIYCWWQINVLLSYMVCQRKDISLKEFLINFEPKMVSKSIKCIYCGDHAQKLQYSLAKMHIQKCSNCHHYVFNRDSIFWLFHYFTGNYSSIGRLYKKNIDTGLYSIEGGNWVDDNFKIGYLDADILNKVVESIKKKSIDKFEESFIGRYIFEINSSKLLIKPIE